MDAYERVLGDAMAGDATLFAREDYVEEAWRIVDPVLKAGTPVHEYEPKTWGPAEVECHSSRRMVQPGRDRLNTCQHIGGWTDVPKLTSVLVPATTELPTPHASPRSPARRAATSVVPP